MAVSQQSIHETDSLITDSRRSILELPRSHSYRATVYSLATARFHRYLLSNQKDDLDKTILLLTESILLQPWSIPGPKSSIILIFIDLAVALYLRSDDSKQPDDATFSAKYLRHLRDQPLEMFGIPRSLVTLPLVEALAIQVKLEAGNVMQNIEEMAVLCHELLASESGVSEGDTTRPVTLIYEAVLSKIRPGVPDQPLDQVIKCLRVARTHKPDLRGVGRALFTSLAVRYFITFANDDYKEATSVMDEMAASRPPEDSQDEFAVAQEVVTLLAMIRSMLHRTPEHSEEAINRACTSLTSAPVERPDLLLAKVLEFTEMQRFHDFGSIEGLEASSSKSPLSWPVVSTGGYDEKGESKYGLREDSKLLEGLLSKIRSNDTTDIEEAIEIGRTILASSDPKRHSPFTFHSLEVFSQILFEGFQRTKKVEYLDESISTRRRVLEFPSAHLIGGPVILHSLAMSFLTRFVSFPDHRMQDLDEGLKLLSQGADHGHGSLPVRVKIASLWATYARWTRHSSISAAYEMALSLVQNALLFAPTLQVQNATLAMKFDHYHAMPLDYASYHIELGQLKEAIQTLERGRALLWSEMRDLRTSVDQLLQAHPHLAHKFAAVNRDLEELTKSIPPSLDLNIDNDGADDLMVVDPFGRLLQKQRELLKERNELISQIQVLPGFDDFLASPSFDTLCSAASYGPVIIINHSSYRSDILILLHDKTLSLISTPDDFFRRASALKDDLLDARNKHTPDSDPYNKTLEYILKELYNLVGKPVIDRLRQLKVPEQSRVWWCPTSVFCSLPLHAMGPIPSDDGGDKRYFLDLYIPSYTPTLSALILGSDRHEPGLPTSGLPSLLLVAHFDVPLPDASFSEAFEDVKVVQALDTRLPIKSLISEGATTTSALDSLRDHQFIHFICHGTLEARKPFDAGFELHGNQRLTLLDIVRSHLPAAEFAFLSACHTAELTDGSSADEGLHLAAAVQYCGFRSVVGTMWAMADLDGPDLAKHFYKTMFPRREQGEPVQYYKRSAGALRDAVKKLQKKRGITLERWVNFVHYGA
ncbi:CHAT domain-containing protein [Lactarius psammicola]|nr:CHAT domain-containing protein [Lactarius psammicola]